MHSLLKKIEYASKIIAGRIITRSAIRESGAVRAFLNTPGKSDVEIISAGLLRHKATAKLILINGTVVYTA